MLQQNETHQRSSEETRLRIFAATRQLLARKGRRGTTTREIAEVAGVNEATLFRHFGNKDALISACVDHYCPADVLQELLPSLTGNVAEDLRKIARLMIAEMDRLRDLILVTFAEEEQWKAAGDAAWRAPSVIHGMLKQFMARRVESGELEGDPALLARFFMGTLFSYVVGRERLPYPSMSADEIVDFNINVFLNGVRKKN
jgi:AcrR family transcriptional regulator